MTSVHPVSILLVSELAHQAPALELVLAELGLSCVRVHGAAALAQARSAEFALILIDASGDGSGKIGLVGQLHANSCCARTPLIVLAPAADAAFPAEAMYAAGALDVVTGTLSPVVLRAKLAFFIDAYRTAAAQRSSEAVLRDTRAQLDTTLAAAELATWSWDVESGRVLADAAMARMFNVSPEDARGGPVEAYLSAIHPDDLAATQASIERALDSGADYDVGYRVRGADGQYRSVIARGQFEPGPAGSARRLRGVVIDVTRQKLAEEQLRLSEERYRTLFDSIDEGVCVIEMLFDADGQPCDYRFLEMNPAFVKHTGLKNAIGKTMLELVPGHDAHWFVTYGRVATSGEAVRFVEQAKAMNRWYDVYATRVGGAGSCRVAVLFTDISERVAAEAELRRLARDLAEADRRKTEFLATLAHELRNPLAPLRSGLQVLRLASSASQGTERVHQIMERQLNHMVALVDDLLDVARITRGQVWLKPEWIDLGQMLAGAVETSMPLIDSAHHRLELDLPAEALALYADPTRMRQVVSNLLNNAAKYTPRGGRIALSARREGADLLISVADNGVGIAAESLEAVFDMFTQVGRDRHASGGGLGIGLSLVRSLAELHGGSASATSAGPHQGSVFTVRLPLPERAPGTGDLPGATAGTPAVAGLRILVVDDNADAASLLADLLGLIGHHAHVANDARQALAMAPKLQPHVMFLDLGMPDMNGYELARALRTDRRHDGALLVALTGWGGDADRARTREAGFGLHLTKPVNLEAVSGLLASHAAAMTGAGRVA